MANVIKIKRKPQANGAGVPNNLSAGELAFSEADAKLFYGLDTAGTVSPIEIAGSGYVLSKIASSAGSGLLSNGTGNDTLLHVGSGDGISVSANAIAVDSTVVRNTGDKYIAGNTTFGPNGTSASVTITDSSEGGMGFRIKSYTFSPTNSTGAAFDLSLNAIGTGKVTTLTTSEITSDITIVLPSGSGTLARLDDITTTNLTGTLAVNKGGTGRTSYSNGQILIGSGTSLAANTLTAGTGVGITNGSGTITINTNATSTNTASAIISRDASGNFSAGGVTATSITVDGTISARSSASANVATQIPVFTGDPSSTTRSVVTRTPAQLLSDIGAYAATNPNGYTSNAGTVTAVSAGSGMNFSSISTNGNVVLGTPSSVTLSSTNSLSATSHTHAFAPGGTTSQYLRGDGSLATFPSIPTVNDATLTLNVSGTGLSGSQTFTANQSTAATFTVTSNATAANTASAVVARDASGNFSAGTITASLNGNANTVTSGVYTDRSITINGTTNQITSSAGAQDLSANRTWTLSLPQDINSTATPTFGGLTVNGTSNTRASVSATAATQIAVFNADPASTTRALVTRTPAQILSDIGAAATNQTMFIGTTSVAINRSSASLSLAGVSIDGNAGTVTNGVYTTGSQTINGAKTFGDAAVFSSGLSVNSQKITNLATPTADSDAATKAYVDAARNGLDVKQSVRVATVQAFNSGLSVTYSGGNSISGTNVGLIPNIDGVTLVNGDRILVKDESNAPYNGIYTVTSIGGAGSTWQLNRATDADVSAEVTAGMFTFVTEGTVNADSGWVLTTNDTIILGTTGLVFAQFSGAGQISAVSGLVKNGNNIGLASAYGDSINPYGSKTANTVLAAPTGSAGVPSFRTLVAGDIPSLGNITNAGAIGSTANLPIITTSNGVLSAGSFGTTANTFCQGNDSRLSDTRNTTNSLTINNGGAGDASSFTFNGSATRTISYNSIGAPSISGANATGTWNISVTGNAGTVTNGVYTNGSYSDPAWITSLAKSKVGLGNVENTALSTWAGSTNLTTLGTISTGTWSATTIAVDRGGTGQTTYSNGQLLIGSGTSLARNTLTQGTGIVITNGSGTITINHNDTSTLNGLQGGNGISSITVDELGHVTAVGLPASAYLTSGTVCAAIVDCTIDGGTFS